MTSKRLPLLLFALALLLAGCGSGPGLRPLGSPLEATDPSLGFTTLVTIGTGLAGHRQVQWRPVAALQPLLPPHLDQPDARPLQVSVDGAGQRLAVLRERKGRAELVLHDLRLGVSRRPMGSLGRSASVPTGASWRWR